MKLLASCKTQPASQTLFSIKAHNLKIIVLPYICKQNITLGRNSEEIEETKID
jgi:arsenate reductase-like glutaredoxin family protein